MKGIINFLVLFSIAYVHCAPLDESKWLSALEDIQRERRLRVENPYDWRHNINNKKESRDVISLQELLKNSNHRDEETSEETNERPSIPLKVLRTKKKLESSDDDSDSQETKRISHRKRKMPKEKSSEQESDESSIRNSNDNSPKRKDRREKKRSKDNSSESNLTEDSDSVDSSDKSRNKHSKRRNDNSRNKKWKHNSDEHDSRSVSDDDADSDEEEFKKYLENVLKKKHSGQIQQILRNGDMSEREKLSRAEIYYNKLYKSYRDRYLEWKRKIDLKKQVHPEKLNLIRKKIMSICNIPDELEDDEQEEQIRKCVRSHVDANDKFNMTTDLSVIHSLSSAKKNVSKWVRVENGNGSRVVKITINKPQSNSGAQQINISKEIQTGLDQSSSKGTVHKVINKVHSSAGIPISDNLVPAINEVSSSAPESVDNSDGSKNTVDKGASDNKDNDSNDVPITEKENDPTSNKEISSNDGKQQTESNIEGKIEEQQKAIIPVEENVDIGKGNKQATSNSQPEKLPIGNEIRSSELPTENNTINAPNNVETSNGTNNVLDNGLTDNNKTSTSINSTSQLPNTAQTQVEAKLEEGLVPENPESIVETKQATESSVSKIGPIDDSADAKSINISTNTSNVLEENKSVTSSVNEQHNSSAIDATLRNQQTEIEDSNVTKEEAAETRPGAINVDDNNPTTAIEINNARNGSETSSNNVTEQPSLNGSSISISTVSVPQTNNSGTTGEIEETGSRSGSTLNVSSSSSHNEVVTCDTRGAAVSEKSNIDASSMQVDSSTVVADISRREETITLPETGSSIIVEESKGTTVANSSSNISNDVIVIVESNNVLNSNESTLTIDDKTMSNDNKSTIPQDSQTTLSSTQSGSTLANGNALNNSTPIIKLNNTSDTNSNIQENAVVGASTTSENNITVSPIIAEEQVAESSKLQPEIILSDDPNLLNNDTIKTELNNTLDNSPVVKGRSINESTSANGEVSSILQTESPILTERGQTTLEKSQPEINQIDSGNNIVIEINNTSDTHQPNSDSSKTNISGGESTTSDGILGTSAIIETSVAELEQPLNSTTEIIIVDGNIEASDNRSVLVNSTVDNTDGLSRNVSEPSDVNANQSTVLNGVQSGKFATDMISIANSANSQASVPRLNTASVTVNLSPVNDDNSIYNTIVSQAISSVSSTENPTSESPMILI